MSLRLRLIVAFVALSVVPLAAITWYSYSRNERALREAAARESDLLAGELTARMSVITKQLSERIEQVMDIESGESADAPPALASNIRPSAASASATKPASGVRAPDSTAPASAPEALADASDGLDSANAAFEASVAARLGEAAMLLNHLEFRSSPIDTQRTPSAGADRSPSEFGTSPDRPFPRSGPTFSRSNSSPTRSTPQPPRAGQPDAGSSSATAGTARGDNRPSGNEAPRTPRFNPWALPPMWGPPAPGRSGYGLSVDLTERRRQLLRGMMAPGSSFDAMTAGERQRVVDEVNQRLLGIRRDLERQAADQQKQVAAAGSRTKTQTAPPRARAGAPAATTPAARANGSRPASTTRLELSGNRLNVRREQDGVVRQIDAEINLPDLLATVFSATPRDRGEIPFAIGKDSQLYTAAIEDRQKIEALGPSVTSATAPLGMTRLPDWTVVTTADPTGSGLHFGIARPVGDALKDVKSAAVRTAGLGLLFIVVTLIGIVPLSGGLTRSLSRLNEGVHRIASGDYGARVQVERQDEIGTLARAFNRMAEDVERHQHLAVEQERIARELELGRQIQLDMLPRAPLRTAAIAAYGDSIPAGEVGGDFFNYFEMKGGSTALLVGDVSGKGVGAALLMANVQAALRTRLMLGQPLTTLAEEIDREIQDNTPEPVYATLFVAVFDPATRIIRYVNAGHHPQYLLRQDGTLQRLASTGLPAGLLAGRGYTEAHVPVASGDMLVCYTDGCIEAENEAGEMFGAEALEREILSARLREPDAMLRHLQDHLRRFRGAREPFDDATMMVIGIV